MGSKKVTAAIGAVVITAAMLVGVSALARAQVQRHAAVATVAAVSSDLGGKTRT
jgi:hypothetical protein